MIYLESPGSVDLGLVDICAVTSLAKERSILTVLDNTYSTPLFQKPLELGIDISIHSCTKYIGGHADVMAGAVITSRKLMKNIFEFGFKLHGAVLSPHDAFLLLRGLRTLPSRLQSLQQITIDVVNFLQRHERVLKVNHPLAYSDSDQLIFKQQASGYTGLLSVELDVDNFTELGEIIDKLTLFPLGFSWGGYENLVVAPYANGDFTELRSQGLTPNLVRFSLGLFDSSSIIADLAQALQR